MKVKNSIYVVALFGMLSCQNQNEKLVENRPESEWIKDTSYITKGNYLVEVNCCHDCHSPKIFNEHGFTLDPDRILSGSSQNKKTAFIDTSVLIDWVLFNDDFTAAVGPWGVSYAANLTSDATGIGNWSFNQFKKALREGKYKGLDNSRALLPPMPWENFKNFTDQDLRSIFAYLKHTKPVENHVPAPRTPANYNNQTNG